MIDNADDLRDKANEFKTGLKKQSITSLLEMKNTVLEFQVLVKNP